MRFEDLYTNFLDMPDAERQAFFSNYYQRRSDDLINNVTAEVTVKKERGKGKTDKKVTLTKEQFELMKQLGLC